MNSANPGGSAIAPSKTQLAYDRIKSMILNGEISPGQPVVERTVCEELGISRTPMRAALSRLAEEGLVDIGPGRGVCVSRIRFEDMIEVYDIREALECMSIKLMTERVSNEELDQLKQIVEEMRHQDGRTFMNLDMDLHITMAVYSRNKRLARNISQIYSTIRLMASTAQNDEALLGSAWQDHSDILAAVESRKADLAVETMRRHIQNMKDYHIRHYFVFSPEDR